MCSLRLILLLSAGLTAVPALAEDLPGDEPRDAKRSEIVVTAPRIAGQIEVPEAPIVTLDESDIASYGASSLTDLITALAPQTGSGRGRGGGPPAILINGQRISNFREFRNIPPEAIRRVEVFPEEVALRYGFRPDQRVVNLILRDNFASRSFDVELEGPDRGGYLTSEFEASLLKIDKASRFNLNVQVNDSSMLTEAERGVIQQPGTVPTVSGDPDPAAFRSLVADSRELGLTGSWSTGLGKDKRGGSLSFNANITRSDSRSLSGLDTVLLTAPGGATALRSLPDPLERTTRITGIQGGATLNLPWGRWQLTVTGDGGVSKSDTRTGRRRDNSALVAAASAGTPAIDGPLPAQPGRAIDVANSRNTSFTSQSTLIGSPFRLPAGEASLTFKAGYARAVIDSRDTRGGGAAVSLNRGDLSTGINFSLPITSRRESFGAGLGDLTLNFGAGLNELSDFGTLTDWNAGLNWKPIEKLSLQASYLVNQAAPTLGDLGNPLIVVPNVAVYDFARNETVLATITSGGNPLLRREEQRDLKFGLNWELPALRNSNLLIEYFRNHSSDVTSAFPVLTPAIEAAFPSRVTRCTGAPGDPAGCLPGQLLSIDRRPVTFAETQGERLRWGLNVSGTIGKAPPGGPGGPGGMGGMGGRGGPGGGSPPGGGGSGRGPGMGGGGFGGPMMAMFGGGQGRWSLSVYHTWRFEEFVLVAPGGPVLDLLDGDALTGGGVARHALEFEGGAFHKGLGLRFNGNFTAPTRIRASGAPGTSDLRFGSLLRLDLRAFVMFDQKKKLVKAVPFLKGSRLMFVVENVFDQRQKVTDAGGVVPLGYQPDYLDPRGRFLGIDFRKLF